MALEKNDLNQIRKIVREEVSEEVGSAKKEILQILGQEVKDIELEVKDLKRNIKKEKSFFSNKNNPYYIKLCGYWERVIRAEKELERREHA